MTVTVTKPKFNLREELTALRRKVGLFGNQILRAETADDFYNTVGISNRNWVINGNMEISQRGDYTTASDWVNNTYSVDRWKCDRNLACTVQQMTTSTTTLPASSTSKNSLKLSSTATGTGYLGAAQYIEHYANLIGKTITISAWVKSNNSQARLTWYDGGGWFVSNAHSGNGGWEKLTVTGRVHTSASQGRYALYICSSNISNTYVTSGDYIEFTDVQLEVGGIATPYERRPYGQEFTLCQRYYQLHGKTTGNNHLLSSPAIVRTGFLTLAYATHQFMVPMRTAPTLGYGGNLNGMKFNGSGYGVDSLLALTIENASTRNCVVRLEKSSGSWTAGDIVALTDNDGTGYVTFNAEL